MKESSVKLFAFPAVCCGVVLVAVRLVCFFLGGWEGALGERHVLCQSIPTARVGSAGLSEKRVRLHAELQEGRGEEFPAQLCTMLCDTGQLDHGSAVGSDEEKERSKSRMGRN